MKARRETDGGGTWARRGAAAAIVAATLLGGSACGRGDAGDARPQAGVAASESDAPGSNAAAPMAMATDSTGGRALYEAHCQECHGSRGLGDGPLAAALPMKPANIQEHLGHHTEAELVRLIQAGVPPAMPPAPVTAEEVARIIDYAWTLLPDSARAAAREMQTMRESGMPMDSMRMPGMPMPGMPAGGPAGAMPSMPMPDSVRGGP